MAHNRRFVLSFLNKSKYTDAFKEEMLCDQMTAETLVRTSSGDIISPDALSRYVNHEQWISSQANTYGFNGELYDVTNTTMVLPSVIDGMSNIINDPITLPDSTSKFIVSLDCDCVLVDMDLSRYLEPDIEINITMTAGGVQHNIASNSSMCGCCVVDMDHIDGGTPINIESISVNSDRLPRDMRIVLHSIFIAISEK